jgi:hypothetical protein
MREKQLSNPSTVKGSRACTRLALEQHLGRAGRGTGRAGGRRVAAGRRAQRAHGRAQQQLLLLGQPADGEHGRRALARACAPAPPAARRARGAPPTASWTSCSDTLVAILQ